MLLRQILLWYIIITITSCAVVPHQYLVSPTKLLTHSEVMALDYPNKKSVFQEYGSPTKKETYDSIENWYFKLGEITNTSSVGLMSGSTKIKQDPLNPFIPAINRTIVANQHQVSNSISTSTSRETYVKFWFESDTVIKWETFGVDYQRLVVNPLYDQNKKMEIDSQRIAAKNKKNLPLEIGSFTSVILFWLIFIY